jgi:hypothetical protein
MANKGQTTGSFFRMARTLDEALELIKQNRNPRTAGHVNRRRRTRNKKKLWEDGVYENALIQDNPRRQPTGPKKKVTLPYLQFLSKDNRD